jgi:hypothetical protein
MMMVDYFSKMKSYTDDMTASGHPLSDEEFIAYALTSLDEELYNPLVSSIVTRVEPISLPKLYSQMLSYELRVDKQSGGRYVSQMCANAAACGHGSPYPQRGSSGLGRGRGRSCDTGRGAPSSSHDGFNNNANYRCPMPTDQTDSQAHPKWQVCLKLGHTANICWYRFDEDFVPHTHVVAMASTSSGNDLNWYLDSGAIDHIIGELERLTMHERYVDNDQIRAANGAGMNITHIGKSILPNSFCPLYLNHVLHVPRAHKQLVSIHHFNLDNHIVIELHPFFFLIKH